MLRDESADPLWDGDAADNGLAHLRICRGRMIEALQLFGREPPHSFEFEQKVPTIIETVRVLKGCNEIIRRRLAQ